MFGFIRNFFSKNRPEVDDNWDWLRYPQADFGNSGTLYVGGVPVGSITKMSMNISHNTEQLTQSDLQFLRHILTKHIRAADQVKKDLKEEALEYEVGDDLRNILFREHREIKAYLKKLSALQYRLKHKIKVGD